MNFLEAVLYGVLQGVTEYLPVSSSAHLILLPKALNISDPGLTFDVALHFGTLGSTLFYFRKDWKSILWGALSENQSTRKKSMNFIFLIALGTFPALLFGGLLQGWIRTSFRESTWILFTLVFGGFLLWFSDSFSKVTRQIDNLKEKHVFLIGLFQSLALFPGMSRSGSTISGGRILGLSRQDAARFSFMLSLPITTAAFVFELRHWRDLLDAQMPFFLVFVAVISSFLSGLMSIAFLLKLVQKIPYSIFAYYRFILAAIIYIFLF